MFKIKQYNFIHPCIVMLVTLCVSGILMFFYMSGELRGNIDWSILPSADYETPDALSAKGFEPLYIKKGISGWDGQFYYYIANDILAQTDAKYKVEMAPYRYQRIGVPLIAKAASMVLGYDYVPVPVFYGTSVLLVLAASFFFAGFLQRYGFSPYLSLLWSLAAGTQITALNGLPDAGADALLLMAFVALFSERFFLYMASISLCVLSREIYILFPIGIVLDYAWRARKHLFNRVNITRILLLGTPVIIWAGWQSYLKLHFSDVPPVNVFKEKLLDFFPLASWGHFAIGSLIGEHPIFMDQSTSYLEAANLLSFIVLLFLSFYFLFYFLAKTRSEQNHTYGISGAFLIIFASYLFFGETVMRHYTGFLKTISVCFVCIILCFVFQKKRLNNLTLLILLLGFALPQLTLYVRVTDPPTSQSQFSGNYTKSLNVKELPMLAPCVADLKYTLKYVDRENFSKNPFFAQIAGQNDIFTVHLLVKNTSQYPWLLGKADHIIWLGSDWHEKDNGQFISTITWPSLLQAPLNPDEERIMPIVVNVPKGEPKIIRFFIAQSNCPAPSTGELLIEWN